MTAKRSRTASSPRRQRQDRRAGNAASDESDEKDDYHLRLAAELSCFPIGMQPDPITDTNLVDQLERADLQNGAYSNLSNQLAASGDPRIRQQVDQVLAVNRGNPR